MKLVEVMPLAKIHRPFNAKKMREQKVLPFRYYNIIQPNKIVAEMNWLTRHCMEQNELLIITVHAGGSTYLEKGPSLDRMDPIAFFSSAFNCGHETSDVDLLCDCLVNMTKQEVPLELREMLYGRAPFWRAEYAGIKMILSRKTAVLPDYLLDKELPVLHIPDVRKPA